MTTATLQTPARTDASWLRLTFVGIAFAIVGLLMMGLAMLLVPSVNEGGDFTRAADYVLTVSALPQGLGLLLATLGVHRLQRGRDGRLGTVGVWVYAVCMAELVTQCTASVIAGSELIWGPLYPVCAFGLMVGLALLAAGSWRVGLLPRWMLAVWPPLGLVGSFLGVGPIPLLFVAFLVALAVVLRGRVEH
ncbi:MAG TPA: hypothetical protein VHO27_11450 [Angustibacter sp.]|nr:hypothetical protein [Angustibacter sp.]